MMDSRTILILGGTGEARELAARLDATAGLAVTVSLAGRTAAPRPQAGKLRLGGFGGAEDLARHLREAGVDVLVDATHPFAARISANAAAAARAAGVPLVVLDRPPWRPEPGDRWIAADNARHAAELLGDAPKTVFLAIGRQDIAPFAAAPRHRYIVRSVEPPDPAALPDGARVILARGPFDEAAEHRLLTENGVDILVSKNSGGRATCGKIAAARALGIPVVMIARPPAVAAERVFDVEAAAARVAHLAGLGLERGA